MKIKGFLLVFFTVALLSCSEAEDVSSYSVICDIFTEAENSSQILSTSELLSSLAENVSEKDDVYVAWQGLIHMIPEQRYEAFQSVAQELDTPDWVCPAMESLAPKL